VTVGRIKYDYQIGAKIIIIGPSKSMDLLFSRDEQNWRGVPEFKKDVFVETGKVAISSVQLYIVQCILLVTRMRMGIPR
jgi:hypothetical protein